MSSDIGLFVISSAIIAPSNSIYSTEERLAQTFETITSIDKYCPNNRKILFDASYQTIPNDYIEKLNEKKVSIIITGENETVNVSSKRGLKSVGESLSFLMTLNFIKDNQIKGTRIYKLSGRYRLNDNFKTGFEHKGKYVFTVPTKTWMSEERVKQTGVDYVYQSRLFHFDYDLLDQFISELQNVIKDCSTLGIDIEHGYYKYFNKYNPIELEKIGVEGNLAPNGESINE